MPVRTVELNLGGQSLKLVRNFNTTIAIEKRFGTFDLAQLLSKPGEQFHNMLALLSCLTRTPEDQLGEVLDMSDVSVISEKLIELMGGEVVRDPRSLAPFVPTPEVMVERMLDVAGFQQGEVFLDPCCGDGRTLAAAAKRGASLVVGHEINEERYEITRKALEGQRRDILPVDGMNADFRHADVVFLFTLPESNRKLQPLLLAQCKDSCRIVSNTFDMPGWTPYHEETFDGRKFYAWRMSDVRPPAHADTAALSTAAA